MTEQEICGLFRDYSLYLFEGQDSYGGRNPILDLLYKEYNIETKKQPEFNLFFEIGDLNMAWLRDKLDYMPMPDDYMVMSNIPWNGIITSSIDSMLNRAMRTTWRRVESVHDVKALERKSICDRDNLIIGELYGSIGGAHQEDLIPLSKRELRSARFDAVAILRHYREVAGGSRSVLIINHYDPSNDWLTLDDMLTFINDTKFKQILYFGKSLSRDSEEWGDLVDEGRIIEIDTSLSEYVAHLEENEILSVDELVLNRRNSKRVFVKGHSYSIPMEIYSEINKQAILLDDTVLIEEVEEREKDFEKFLANSDVNPLWKGYAAGFYASRDKDESLISDIRIAAKNAFQSKPIVVFGQAGSGKSTMIGNAAYTLKCDKNYPVLFIPQCANGIEYQMLDNVCKWLQENCKAECVVIFWDKSVFQKEIDAYINLKNWLASKGRNIVIVGTSHGISDERMSGNCIPLDINPELSDQEMENVLSIYNDYSGQPMNREQFVRIGQKHLLISLYRLLHDARRKISKSIVEEAKSDRSVLENVLERISEYGNYPFYDLLKNFKIPNEISEDDITVVKSDMTMIMDMVCIAGKYNLSVPLNLIFSYYGYQHAVKIYEIVEDMDFFMVWEDAYGHWLIKTRNDVEADMVVRATIKNKDDFIKIICSMINSASASSEDNNSYKDLDFIADLVRSIGPNGQAKEEYQKYYSQIADALKEQRENGIYNDRIVLQEVMFRRESVRALEGNADKLAIVNEAEEIIENQIMVMNLHKTRMNREKLGKFLGEKVSCLGTELKVLCDTKELSDMEIVTKFRILTENAYEVMNYLPESTYSIDVLSWAGEAILTKDKLREQTRVIIYSSVLEAFEQYRIINGSNYNIEAYNKGINRIAETAGDVELAERTYQELLKENSTAGIFFRVKMRLGEVGLYSLARNKERLIINNALQIFEENKELVYQNTACLYMMLQLYWLSYTGKPLLYKEKDTVHLTFDEWQNIIAITEQLFVLQPDWDYPIPRYIYAIALFHIGNISESQRVFRRLRNINYPFDKRIVINYLATGENKEAKTYIGKISRFGDKEKESLISIPDIGIEVPYFNEEFTQKHITLNETISGVRLGFNMLGIQVAGVDAKGR